ncbi:MAG: dihydropteroate synthase [Bacteroidales bacterium]|nr:dihydropteroate synthase [Bacteroidales bacterium]
MIKVLGIININEDSFYKGSRTTAEGATLRAAQLITEGADILDIGAVSTRPGATLPSEREEWKRLQPALESIRKAFPDVAISIDTFRAGIVKRACDAAGPVIVNDISAGNLDGTMLKTAGELGLQYIAMHMRGTPLTMMALTNYEDVVAAVKGYFWEFSAKADDNGIKDWVLDPGFGFAKTSAQSFELLRRLPELLDLGRPILAGLSRKSMIYKTLDITPEEALTGTQVLNFKALEGGATWLRVHDVAETVRTVKLFHAINGE